MSDAVEETKAALEFDFDVRRGIRRSNRKDPGVPARVVTITYEPSPEADRRFWEAIGILLRDKPMEPPKRRTP
jgi:hypothetical protein